MQQYRVVFKCDEDPAHIVTIISEGLGICPAVESACHMLIEKSTGGYFYYPAEVKLLKRKVKGENHD